MLVVNRYVSLKVKTAFKVSKSWITPIGLLY